MENVELIQKLKAVKEDMEIIYGLASRIDVCKNNINEAEKIIDSILYDLTGDNFYLSKDGL